MTKRETLTPAERRLGELVLEHYDHDGEPLYAVLLADLMSLCDKLNLDFDRVHEVARGIATNRAINDNLPDGFNALGGED